MKIGEHNGYDLHLPVEPTDVGRFNNTMLLIVLKNGDVVKSFEFHERSRAGMGLAIRQAKQFCDKQRRNGK